MSASRSRFLSGSDWKQDPLISAAPLRQPYTPTNINSNPGFDNHSPMYRNDQPALDRYLTNAAGVSVSQSSAVPPYIGSPFSSVPMGGMGVNDFVYITNEQLDSCFSYALHRGNGVYTRLIPADRLPLLNGVAQNQGPEGLIVLPTPRGTSPANRSSLHSDESYYFTPSVIGDGRPLTRATPTIKDPVQTHHNSAATAGIIANTPKIRIDTIVTSAPPGPPKKIKIYCDKWLHDGTCAFTQQGCRYKHEMPMDRPTQIEVGLFNGLPMWYKRAQANDLRAGTNSFVSPAAAAITTGNIGDFDQVNAYGNGNGNGNAAVRRNGGFENVVNWRGGNMGRGIPHQPRIDFASGIGGNINATDASRNLSLNEIRRPWIPPYHYPRDGQYNRILPSTDHKDIISRNGYEGLYEYGEDGADEA